MPGRALLLTAIAALAGCVEPDDELRARRVDRAHVASLRAPVIAPLGQPVTLDASATTGRDLEPLAFDFEISDGSEPVRGADPTLQHVFARVGLFSVRVRVVDPAGREAVAIQDVTVRADRPPPCLRATDCLVGDECDAGLCWSTGGSIE